MKSKHPQICLGRIERLQWSSKTFKKMCYSEAFKLGFLVCFPLFSLINSSFILGI